MLVIPVPLIEARKLCSHIELLIRDGELIRSHKGVKDWIAQPNTVRAQRSRRQMINQVNDFLEGKTLEEANHVLKEKYLAYLNTDPAAQAAKIICKAYVYSKDASIVPTEDWDAFALLWLPDWVRA